MTNKMKQELGWAADRAVFGTDDPQALRQQFQQSMEAWKKERSTLGGYLRDLRRTRDLLPTDCADKTGVSRATWQAWESDRLSPSPSELEKLCHSLSLSEQKRLDLKRLSEQAPRHRLLLLARTRPELLAARGVASLESALEWQKLPEGVQERLAAWCRQNKLDTPEALSNHLSALEDDNSREAWADEVYRSLD